MKLRPEHIEAIRALNGATGDPAPVIRLLRNPSTLHPYVRELLVELLSTDEELRQLAAKPSELRQVSINPLVLRVRGNGKGRLKKGQDKESTRRRWIKCLELKEKRAKLVQLEPLSEIADALEPDVAGSRYRLTLEQRRAGNIENPESESLIIGHMLLRKNREERPGADSFGGCFDIFTLELAAELGMCQRTVAGHWQIYRDVMLRFYREKIAELIAARFK